MVKIGANVPQIIDKAVDFMASSQAFLEYLKKTPRMDEVPAQIPEEKMAFFLERLNYYRALYTPASEREEQH